MFAWYNFYLWSRPALRLSPSVFITIQAVTARLQGRYTAQGCCKAFQGEFDAESSSVGNFEASELATGRWTLLDVACCSNFSAEPDLALFNTFWASYTNTTESPATWTSTLRSTSRAEDYIRSRSSTADQCGESAIHIYGTIFLKRCKATEEYHRQLPVFKLWRVLVATERQGIQVRKLKFHVTQMKVRWSNPYIWRKSHDVRKQYGFVPIDVTYILKAGAKSKAEIMRLILEAQQRDLGMLSESANYLGMALGFILISGDFQMS
ncbi:hypothetical protein BDZ97DRAFT_2058512 [Flammula alnicola]|nr:hypothetical protein BDZ97DRAFT_2058512 [Flammula alnicola]